MLDTLTISSLAPIWLGLILLIAAVWDGQKRVVPNLLILVGLIGLLGLQILDQSWQPLSFLIGLALGLVLWRLKALGGGDSKLLVLVSAAVSPTQLVWLYLCISLAGAVQALWWQVQKKETALPYAVSILSGTMIYLLLFA